MPSAAPSALAARVAAGGHNTSIANEYPRLYHSKPKSAIKIYTCIILRHIYLPAGELIWRDRPY